MACLHPWRGSTDRLPLIILESSPIVLEKEMLLSNC